jgi:hypothetical protein
MPVGLVGGIEESTPERWVAFDTCPVDAGFAGAADALGARQRLRGCSGRTAGRSPGGGKKSGAPLGGRPPIPSRFRFHMALRLPSPSCHSPDKRILRWARIR